MTRKDLQEKYNIIGENNDIQLFRKRGESKYSNGYCGNIRLTWGKAIFNDKSYSDIASLDAALVEWEKSLPYPVDTYCPLTNESYRIENRIVWYLTEKMGFRRGDGWDRNYVRQIGANCTLTFGIEREEEKIAINSTLGQYTFRNEVDNAEDGIATISSILNSCVLMMAKDMVDIIGVCDNKVTSDIEAYVKSNRCIFGLERVSFKDIMIERLESVLKQLKDS